MNSQEMIPSGVSYAGEQKVADQAGPSIVEAAQEQVAVKKDLASQKHTADLEAAALPMAALAKLGEVGDPPQEAAGAATSAFHRQREELHKDANILITKGHEANERAWDAHIEMEKNDRASTVHLDENLPAYVETATELANADLQPRIGRKALVTSHADGLVGFTEVAPVNPATDNQEVAPPPEAAGPAAS